MEERERDSIKAFCDFWGRERERDMAKQKTPHAGGGETGEDFVWIDVDLRKLYFCDADELMMLMAYSARPGLAPSDEVNFRIN